MRAGSKTFGTGMPALLVRFATGGSAAPGTHLVRYGSKAEKLKTSTSRPLCPRKRTSDLRVLMSTRPSALGLSHVAQGREHPGVEVIEQVAMERPKPGIVGVEGDHDPAPRRHQHGVAHRAGKALAVDFDHLKFVSVQVHRVLHPRLVDEDELDALALCDG